MKKIVLIILLIINNIEGNDCREDGAYQLNIDSTEMFGRGDVSYIAIVKPECLRKVNVKDWYLTFELDKESYIHGKYGDGKHKTYSEDSKIWDNKHKRAMKSKTTMVEYHGVMCYPYFRQVSLNITQPFDILAS